MNLREEEPQNIRDMKAKEEKQGMSFKWGERQEREVTEGWKNRESKNVKENHLEI